MKENNLIEFKTIENVLKENSFYGFTAKREKNGRIIYTFNGFKYPHVEIKVLTLKLEPNKLNGGKIVLGIKINEKEIEGYKLFIEELNEIKRYKKRKKSTTHP